MGILKGILHHWNKTSSAYDTIHPETEVAQITDWNTGIVNTLASTGLSSLVNVLSSDSLLALLIKKVFDATGVKYSLGQNGYACFGSLVGGLIIQWGLVHQTTSQLNTVTPPLTFTTFLTGVATDAGGGMYSKGFGCDGKNFLIYTSTYGAVDTRWIAITR
jgi:hypothetical protein